VSKSVGALLFGTGPQTKYNSSFFTHLRVGVEGGGGDSSPQFVGFTKAQPGVPARPPCRPGFPFHEPVES
jgi:hypothetical protein